MLLNTASPKANATRPRCNWGCAAVFTSFLVSTHASVSRTVDAGNDLKNELGTRTNSHTSFFTDGERDNLIGTAVAGHKLDLGWRTCPA